MKHTTLQKWCKARRGRASALAIYLNRSREFVRQMYTGERAIAVEMRTLLPAAIARIEADEKASLATAMAFITGKRAKP